MFRAPSAAGLPPFAWLLHDQQAARPHVARHLGLSTRTLARYEATQQAPRAVMLALYWESRWGRSAADAEAATAADVHRGHAQALANENAALRRRIAVLERELTQAQPEAANLPFWRA
ncbi:hypothetical protein [Hydrogenophaga intermedia]|uniref:Uncharacterized protein n=1 Tax=Hydrogenophaga intermedia TaxID=65786 RepID=A0A1L1PD95_HYDIT|nr:hypothetical protein [Hydrogenophaga intermedia]TMU72438.1 hypothetical protein FGJ01_18875 [Hydrogenophaga intermedia]CDN87480.1 hypothetical protein BN948_01902 [Hydrogenophaga intermedia]